MTHYRCRVTDANGSVKSFIRAAADKHELARELSFERFYPISIVEISDEAKKKRKPRLKLSLVSTFIQSLAHLVESDLMIRDALEIGRMTFEKEPLRMLAAELEDSVNKGTTLSEAVTKASYGLPGIVASLIRIGEEIGSLGSILPRLSTYLLETKRIRDKVLGAMIYPILVLSVAFLGMIGISVFALPRLAQVFTAIGTGTPRSIEATLKAASTTAVVLPIVSFVCIGIVVFLVTLRKFSVAWDHSIDTWILRLPFVGSFVSNRESLLFCFAMEILAEGGITVSDGLDEAVSVITNKAYRRAIMSVRQDLMNGVPIAESFSSHEFIPGRMKAWIAIGERTGHVQRVFSQLRSYYQREIERWADRFVSLIEPVLILAVGIVMLCLVVFFIVPVLSSMSTLMF